MALLFRSNHRISKLFRSSITATKACELLKDRTVLCVQRESCGEFLQGLITNDMGTLASSNCIYTMFLNSAGRVLFDSFIYKTENPDKFNIELGSDVASAMIKHLNVYSLRKKIEITVSKLLPWVAFEKDADNQRLVADPRCKELFVYRCLSESQPLENVVDGSYSKLRYSLGLTEGPNEIPSGQAFPLEYNADLLNAVSFDKGCYVGQELTARVHHTGVVRKRIMPLELSEAVNGSCGFSEPVIDSETKKPVGKIRGVTENRALALMRISETVSSKGLTWGQLKVRATIPSWWPSLRESSASRR